MSRAPATVVLAGGGSGGHVAPAMAVAERIAQLEPDRPLHVLCSERSIDARMLESDGLDFTALPARPPSVRPIAAAAFLVALQRSIGRAGAVLRAVRAGVVLTLGGFVAVPAAIAARRLGVPVVVLNLDDPPGRANRILFRRSDLVLGAAALEHHPERIHEVVGVPIRRSSLAPGDQRSCRASLGLDPDRRVLLVTGASQGAGSLNALVPRLADPDGPLPAHWQLLHLHGPDRPAVDSIPGDDRLHARPFLEAMGLAWGAADLAISRAGANSVAEVVVNAVPTIFLPYPHHRDRHQHRNAAPAERAGGAVVVEDLLDPEANLEALEPLVRELTRDDGRLASMADALRSIAGPDAADVIARRLLATAADRDP